jgi:hypothetical protein
MLTISRLNEAERCGLAASLDTKATTIHGLRGDAFHAVTAAFYRPLVERFQAEREVSLGRLGEDDRQQVLDMVKPLTSSWRPPTDAVFEAPVGLSRSGFHIEMHRHADGVYRAADPDVGGDLLTAGTPDCAWVETGTDPDDVAQRVAVVVDFKSGARAQWNVPHPADNVQLAGYGFAWADKNACQRMRLGVYYAIDNKWRWQEFHLDTTEATLLWSRVKAAALKDPDEAVMGPHCSDCYVRLRCPAWILPVVSTEVRRLALAPLGSAGAILEPRELLRLEQACKAMQKMADAGMDYLRAYVKQHGPVYVDGWKWGPIPVKGRETVSISALRDAGLYDIAVKEGAVKQGAPTLQHRWTRDKREK